MKDFFKLPPKPSSLLFAIRSIGYSFKTAVADIIDNSISAKANVINIYSDPLDKPFVCFIDNGSGMTYNELKEAMLLGAQKDNRDVLDLGRFGLGLKSASLSQCRKFSVVTKRNNKLYGMRFDIDENEKKQDWVIFNLSPEQLQSLPMYNKFSTLTSGTMVVWEEFDRIENSTKSFEKTFRHQIAESKSHVEFVFHRFYDTIKIFFNEVRIEKRDPFLKASYGRQQEGRGVNVKLSGQTINITPYTLPYSNSLTHEEKQLLGNPKSIYDEQGLYLYRNERLIAWGSWFHTEVRSELNKLARVQVDIPSTLDDIWMLDVKKSSARIPDIIKEKIRVAVNDSTMRSHGTIGHPRQKRLAAKYDIWNRFLSPDSKSVSYRINRSNPLLESLSGRLNHEESKLFESILRQIESFIPKTDIHLDECKDIAIVDPWSSNKEDLENELISLAQMSSDNLKNQEDLLDQFLRTPKFSPLSSLSKHLHERLKNEY